TEDTDGDPDEHAAAARQQDVGDQHDERAAGEQELRHDVDEIGGGNPGRHQRVTSAGGVTVWAGAADAGAASMSGLPSGPQGTAARNRAAGFAAIISGVGAEPHTTAIDGEY